MTRLRLRCTRRLVAIVLGALLLGAVACAPGPPEELVTSVDPEVTPAKFQQFLGNHLRYTDHGDF
ncbi:hypothetical protein, partial [Pseudonocardia yunnanensis]